MEPTLIVISTCKSKRTPATKKGVIKRTSRTDVFVLALPLLLVHAPVLGTNWYSRVTKSRFGLRRFVVVPIIRSFLKTMYVDDTLYYFPNKLPNEKPVA